MPGLPDPSSRSTSLVTFRVKADGNELGADYQIQRIEVSREVNRVPKASIQLHDGDAAAQTFGRSEESSLIPGVEVEILGGYQSDEALLFRGIVVRQRIEVGLYGGTRLTVELRDPVFRMTLGRHSRNFSEVSDSDVMEQLIGLHPGLSSEVSPTSSKQQQVVQHQVSDWDFLVMLAQMTGYGVYSQDGRVQIKAPASAGPAISSAIFGQGLLSADLELDAESQLATVETAAWDPASQELLSAEAEDAASATPGDISGSQLADTSQGKTRLHHPGALDQARLDQWAGADMARSRRAAVRGRIRVQGSADLLPGVLIDLSGLGSRFSGTGYVSGVRHRLGDGDWISELLIGGDPKSHAERYPVAALPAAGASAPVAGLQIGVVTALEGDPAGEERIQIRLTSISETDGLVWARQALLAAGDQRSTLLRPELDDEVVVGFLDSDPHHPVILGALHSSARPSPITASDDNHEKAIVTRSGMRLHWDDDQVITTIDTPNGNRIQLTEADGALLLEDENQNKVTLNSDGITLESSKDLILKATGDVKVEGINVELSASASLKAEGSAGAELSSPANTVVKGALVQIN